MIEPLEPGLYRDVVRRALAEDLGWGDTTTQAMITPDRRAAGVLLARADVVLAGLEVALEVFRQLDPALTVEYCHRDGAACLTGEPIVRIAGLASALLTAERTALNFLRHLSGIASVTRWLVEAGGGRVRIGDTRKTLPTLRALQKYAVRVGGGVNGRMALDEGLIIKANHVRLAGGVRTAVQLARAAHPDTPVEAEVGSLAEADDALLAGASTVLFTGASLDELEQVVRRCAGRARVQVSGAIHVDRLAALVSAGVELALIGAITESAPAADIILELQPL
ncbi:MAG: carboxylating nicotinate-nucleotide diphosphorylase [Acidobacteria bacterium]|nr:carboxylating nicotinate-nucleotide diphosphorylase [Acidobacteriota bacterium]